MNNLTYSKGMTMKARVKRHKSSLISKKPITDREVRYALKYFLRELLSNQMYSQLSVDVVFTNKIGYHWSGEIEIDTDWCDGKLRDFIIFLNPRFTRKVLLSALGHECVHVKQYAENKMKELIRGPHSVRFGRRYFNEQDIPYRSRPWEVEAYELEPLLLERYLTHKKQRKIIF